MYAHALNDAVGPEEVVRLLRAPVGGGMPSGMPENLPFLAESAAAVQGKNGKRANSAEEDSADELVGTNGKRKRKNKKKEKDLNAPRRPPSAYILFQNDVRAKVKENNPGMEYGELLKQIGDQWKTLGEASQAPYKAQAEGAMSDWKRNLELYIKNKPDVSMGFDDAAEAAAVQSEMILPPMPPKKERKSKKNAQASVELPVITNGIVVPPLPPTEKAPASPPKKETKAAAAKRVAAAATSTPAVKNAAPPKPAAPASTKKNAPQTAAESSDSESDESSDDSDD